MSQQLNVVLSERKEHIQIITLNRPERLNAVNKAMMLQLRDVLQTANADEAVKVIVLRGAGRAFCSGDDLEESQEDLSSYMGSQEFREAASALQDVTRFMVGSEKFVVGAIHGWAVGAGFEWAINCDFPIWAEDARAFFPEMQWGLFPTGGVTSLLPRIVGLLKARELLLLGERFSAEQLCELGIAWRVVPQDNLLDEAMAVAAKIASLPAHATRKLKHVINKASLEDLDRVLQWEQEALISAAQHPATLKLLGEFGKSE